MNAVSGKNVITARHNAPINSLHHSSIYLQCINKLYVLKFYYIFDACFLILLHTYFMTLFLFNVLISTTNGCSFSETVNYFIGFTLRNSQKHKLT